MAHELPPLPYAYESLEPYIDTTTMQIHHDKHHAAYVTNLNNALKDQAALQGHTALQLIQNLNDVPEAIRTAVRNNAGGHVNHTMFWEQLKVGTAEPASGKLADAIKRDFGSFDDFKKKFHEAGMTQFGSGWAWLSLKGGKLEITKTPNAECPIKGGATPILCCDVWEHAYYIDYRNARAKFLDTFLASLANWDFAAANYEKAGGK